MRALVRKDVLILGRSKLLVALLVFYPVLLAFLIGFALSRGPDKPRIAIVDPLPPEQQKIAIGSRELDIPTATRALRRSIDVVPAKDEQDASRLVREGEVLAAIVVPPDVVDRLQSRLEPVSVTVLYNADDPVKARFVRDTIKARLRDANAAIGRALVDAAIRDLGLVLDGGKVTIFGRTIEILGLRGSERELRLAARNTSGQTRARIERVAGFAELARRNLGASGGLLRALSEPIALRERVVAGRQRSLDEFAVAVAVAIAVMFVAMLLAAGGLALEREEGVLLRLRRHLAFERILAAKALLSALAGPVSRTLLVLIVALFVPGVPAGVPWWGLGLVVAAAAFGAVGLVIGAVARDVRASSLLAVLAGLPLALLALVPSGAVDRALWELTRVLAALFPFAPALDALEQGLRGALAEGALLHLAALALAYGALARFALARPGAAGP